MIAAARKEYEHGRHARCGEEGGSLIEHRLVGGERHGYVSDDMRDRVQRAMNALNYVPNELARNLYHNRTNMVGVIVPTIRHPFFATFTASLQHMLAGQGLSTMLCSTADARTAKPNMWKCCADISWTAS